MQTRDTPYPASFMAAVALAAVRGEESPTQLAVRFCVPEHLILEWRDNLEQHASIIFETKLTAPSRIHEEFAKNELAQIVAENSTQGFAMMDPDGYCVYANQVWLDMTGYSAEELQSKPLHDLVHHHYPDGRPYPLNECPIDRALPENFNVRAHEDVFFHKDGSRFDVLCAASPIFRGGKPVATIIEIRDVTEQKRQQHELIANERQALDLAETAEKRRRELDALLDAVPIGIGMANSNGELVVVNKANLELWGQTTLYAENVEQYREFKGWWADGKEHHGAPLEPGDWALARALRGETVLEDIVEIQPFDAAAIRKTIWLSARPVFASTGDIAGAVVAQVDITRQKLLEESLRLADKNKDDFIAILAHELRNPLAPLRAAVDLFKLKPLENPMLKRAVDAMTRQVSHITRLVDDLLDVARVSRGKVELKLEPCDVVQIVEQTAEDYRPTVEVKGVELRVLTPSEPIWVRGDVARLAQVIGNLLHNATKFTSTGNHICVKVQEEDGAGQEVSIAVHDDGAGIEPYLVKTLFQPFTKAAEGVGHSSDGLGLGLTLVKGLTEAHGGRVHVQSPGLGQGATFTVRLPTSKHGATSIESQEKEKSQRKLKIVAIDDYQDALDMLCLLLQTHEHTVATALNASEGIDTVKLTKPDVVICDLGLPGELNGYDVARAIRADESLRDVFLIALSGYGHESDRKCSSSAGFDLHLMKPVSFEQLQQELAKIAKAEPASTTA